MLYIYQLSQSHLTLIVFRNEFNLVPASMRWCSAFIGLIYYNCKGNQSWVFIGRTDFEAETPILWPPDAKNWLIWKDPAGKDSGQEEKGTIEDEMVGWHHWLNGHGFGWTPGVDDGQGGLACHGSRGCRESDMTEQLNRMEIIFIMNH